jgi:CheY-like chemotaxis protein
MDIRKILLVDDDKNILTIAGIGLSDTPEWTVVTARSGEEGLAKAVAEKPDVIVLDMEMPDMDGAQVLKKLREDVRTHAIPVVFLTARAQAAELKNFMALGAAGVISKPFDPMNLSTEIKAIFARRPAS